MAAATADVVFTGAAGARRRPEVLRSPQGAHGEASGAPATLRVCRASYPSSGARCRGAREVRRDPDLIRNRRGRSPSCRRCWAARTFRVPLDTPGAELPPSTTRGYERPQSSLQDKMRRENLTVRQLASSGRRAAASADRPANRSRRPSRALVPERSRRRLQHLLPAWMPGGVGGFRRRGHPHPATARAVSGVHTRAGLCARTWDSRVRRIDIIRNSNLYCGMPRQQPIKQFKSSKLCCHWPRRRSS